MIISQNKIHTNGFLQKCFNLALIILLLFSHNVIFGKQKVVIYGDSNYPPYSFEENGKPAGIYVDILNLAFAEMRDYDITIKVIPWKRGLDYIKEGRGFAIFPPYLTEKRIPWMLFSEPILKEESVVFGKYEKLNGKTKWPEDFYGYTFGINRGFSLYALGGDKFGDACRAGKIKISEVNSNEQNFKKLESDRIDFYINDKLLNISYYRSIHKGIAVKENYGHLGFTKKGENFKFLSDFKKVFNKKIKAMKENGEIKEILDRYSK